MTYHAPLTSSARQSRLSLSLAVRHRGRNNLQLVYAMLSKQLDDTTDGNGQRDIKAIARRVSTLAQVYDHLLGTEMTRTIDFGGYVKSLRLNLAEIQATANASIALICESEPLMLDLDAATALGIAVTELVTNAYDHAFASGAGAIFVSLKRSKVDADVATLRVSDNGKGFKINTGGKRHGLGLVRRLIEQIRGTVAVDSVHGTVWTITIPAD
jgi:two-component sensor histidine kinase